MATDSSEAELQEAVETFLETAPDEVKAAIMKIADTFKSSNCTNSNPLFPRQPLWQTQQASSPSLRSLDLQLSSLGLADTLGFTDSLLDMAEQQLEELAKELVETWTRDCGKMTSLTEEGLRKSLTKEGRPLARYQVTTAHLRAAREACEARLHALERFKRIEARGIAQKVNRGLAEVVEDSAKLPAPLRTKLLTRLRRSLQEKGKEITYLLVSQVTDRLQPYFTVVSRRLGATLHQTLQNLDVDSLLEMQSKNLGQEVVAAVEQLGLETMARLVVPDGGGELEPAQDQELRTRGGEVDLLKKLTEQLVTEVDRLKGMVQGEGEGDSNVTVRVSRSVTSSTLYFF